MMDASAFFANRHTVRRFEPRPVEPEMIDALLREAAQAPNTGNMQLYCAVVTATPESVSRLADAHFRQPAAAGAPAIVTFCADLNRMRHWCRMRGADDKAFDNLQAFMWAVMDATIACQQFVTAAEMRGLGCCYLGTALYKGADIARMLELPDGVIPVAAVSVGWPAAEEKAAGPTERLPMRAVAHHERYQPFTDADIDEIYTPLEAEETSKRFVEENCKENLAQVFAEVRYPRQMSEQFSADLLALMRRGGIEI